MDGELCSGLPYTREESGHNATNNTITMSNGLFYYIFFFFSCLPFATKNKKKKMYNIIICIDIRIAQIYYTQTPCNNIIIIIIAEYNIVSYSVHRGHGGIELDF